MADPAIERLAAAALGGDVRALARAATLVEERQTAGCQLIKHLFRHTGQAHILGITGPPGAGKSTLISRLTAHLRAQHHRVAVIAVDPSSSISSGALLGDRIRMAEHYADSGVFIRSMATRGRLGGLAAATLDMTLLLDAARFDFIFIETVGAGQVEIDVTHLAHVTLEVLTPTSGDGVQALKAGIMEVADIFVINKSDLPGADTLESEIRFVQKLAPTEQKLAPIHRVNALDDTGIEALMNTIQESCRGRDKVAANNHAWERLLLDLLREEVKAQVSSDSLSRHAAAVAARDEDPHEAAHALLREIAPPEFR